MAADPRTYRLHAYAGSLRKTVSDPDNVWKTVEDLRREASFSMDIPLNRIQLMCRGASIRRLEDLPNHSVVQLHVRPLLGGEVASEMEANAIQHLKRRQAKEQLILAEQKEHTLLKQKASAPRTYTPLVDALVGNDGVILLTADWAFVGFELLRLLLYLLSIPHMRCVCPLLYPIRRAPFPSYNASG